MAINHSFANESEEITMTIDQLRSMSLAELMTYLYPDVITSLSYVIILNKL